MNKLLAVFLTALLFLPPSPAWALRQEASAEAGLEEQLRDALQSPDNLVRATGRLASTALGLTPVVVRPEPSRRAGLEESGSGASGILEEVFTSLSAVRKSSEIGPEHARRRARALRDFFRAHHSMSNMPENVGDLLMARKPQRRNGPHIRVAVGLFQAIASYLDDPDPQVQADMQETLGLLVRMVRERLGADKSEMQEGIDETLRNLEDPPQEPEVRVAAYGAFQQFLQYVRPSPLQILKIWESARLDLSHEDPRLRKAAVDMVDRFLVEQGMTPGARFDAEELEAAVLVLRNLQNDLDKEVRKSATGSVQFFDQWRNLRREAILDEWIALVAGARGFLDSTSVDGLIRAQLPVRGATTSLSLVTASRSIQPQVVINPALSVDPLSDVSEDQLVIESNFPPDSGGLLKIIETRDELTIARPSGEPLKIRLGFAPRIREIRYNPDVHELILSLDSSTEVKAQRIGMVAVRKDADGPAHLLTLWIDIAKGETAGLEEGLEEFSKLRRTIVDDLGRAQVIEGKPKQGYVRLIPDSLIARQMGLIPKTVLNFLSLNPERAILRNQKEFRVGGVFYSQAMIRLPVVDGIERPLTVLLVLDIPAEVVALYQSTMKAMDGYSSTGRNPTEVLGLYHRDSLLINVGGALWELLPHEFQAEFHDLYPKEGPIYRRMEGRIKTSSVIAETPFGIQRTSRTRGITDLDGEIFAATFSWYLDSGSIWKELGQPPVTDEERSYFEKVLRWLGEQTKSWEPLPGTTYPSASAAGLEETGRVADRVRTDIQRALEEAETLAFSKDSNPRDAAYQAWNLIDRVRDEFGVGGLTPIEAMFLQWRYRRYRLIHFFADTYNPNFPGGIDPEEGKHVPLLTLDMSIKHLKEILSRENQAVWPSADPRDRIEIRLDLAGVHLLRGALRIHNSIGRAEDFQSTDQYLAEAEATSQDNDDYFELELNQLRQQLEDLKRAAGLEEGVAYEGDDWGALAEAIRKKDAAHPVVSLTVYETAADGRTFLVRFWLPNIHENPVNFIAAHWHNSAGKFQFRLSFQDQPAEPEAPLSPAAERTDQPLVHARLDVTRSGLEEDLRIMTTQEVIVQNDDELTQLGMGLASAGSFGLALLPKDLVDQELIEEKPSSLVVYAHPEVASGVATMELFPLEMLNTMVSLDTEPAIANRQLDEAVADEKDGRTVLVGLDSDVYSRQAGLLNVAKIKSLKLLLNPATMGQLKDSRRQLLAFLKRSNQLAGFLIDLRAGFVRTITLDDDKQYYALNIAA